MKKLQSRIINSFAASVLIFLIACNLYSQTRRKSVDTVPPVSIPEEISPLIMKTYESVDSLILPIAYRIPPGKGPFPAVLFFHGGVGGIDPNKAGKKPGTFNGNLLNGAIQTRFLKAGYVVAASTRRSNEKYEIRDQLYAKATQDCAGAVKVIKALPQVDSESVCLYGGSYGGILAISTSTVEKVAAVVAGEPASVEYFFMGLKPPFRKRRAIFDDMKSLLTNQNKEKVRKIIDLSKVSCPVFMMHGNETSSIYKANTEFVIKELRLHNKEVINKQFENLTHGFYWGRTGKGATEEIVETIIKESDRFYQKYIRVKPKPIEL